MSNFAQILKEIGEFGFFQKRLIFLLCIPSIFTACDLIVQVFSGMNFPHHCNTDWILELGSSLTEERQRNLTIPLNKDGNFESCKMFTPVDRDLESIENYGINTTTGCINGSDFEKPKGASSIVTEFNLVCDRNGLIEVSQSIHMVGLLIGSFVMGPFADRFGRRIVVLLSLLLLALCGVGAGLSPNVYVYMALQLIGGTAVAGLSLTVYVIGVEWNEPSKFAVSTLLGDVAYPVGLVLVTGVAYLIHNWRILQMVLFSPLVPVLVVFYWLLPESARWLLTRGRKDEAMKFIRRAAKLNKRSIPDNLLDKLEIEATPKSGSLLDIFRVSYLRKRVLIMSCAWFSTSLMYFGLSLNVGNFGLDIYLTQLIFAIVEFPAYLGLLPAIQYFGRRICLSVTLIFGGVACLVILFIPTDLPVVITTIAVVGKFGAAASFATVYVYSAELYPTIVRQSAVGMNSTCSRVAGILAPLVRLLNVYHHSIPMLVYGIIPTIVGGLCFLLPETLNVDLQDHLEPIKPKDETAQNKSFAMETKSGQSTKM